MAKKFINLNFNNFNEIKEKFSNELKKYANFFVSVPAGLIGFTELRNFPDKDISLLGIGSHRYFLFHSAIGLYILKKFYEKYINEFENKDTIQNKIFGASLSAAAVGIGFHLLSDCFSPKPVIFPFIGSLMDGTLIDDKLWLLGNSLWCFKIARDTYVLAFGKDLSSVKEFVRKIYSSESLDGIKEFIKKHSVISGVVIGSTLEEIVEYLFPDIGELGLLGDIGGGVLGLGWRVLKEIMQLLKKKSMPIS